MVFLNSSIQTRRRLGGMTTSVAPSRTAPSRREVIPPGTQEQRMGNLLCDGHTRLGVFGETSAGRCLSANLL